MESKEKKKAESAKEDAGDKKPAAQAKKEASKADEPIPIGKKKKGDKPSEEEIKEQREAKAAEKARRKAEREATVSSNAKKTEASTPATNGTTGGKKKGNATTPENYPVEEGWDMVTKRTQSSPNKKKKAEEPEKVTSVSAGRFAALG